MSAAVVVADVQELFLNDTGFDAPTSAIRDIEKATDALDYLPSYLSQHEDVNLDDLRDYIENNGGYAVTAPSQEGDQYVHELRTAEDILSHF